MLLLLVRFLHEPLHAGVAGPIMPPLHEYDAYLAAAASDVDTISLPLELTRSHRMCTNHQSLCSKELAPADLRVPFFRPRPQVSTLQFRLRNPKLNENQGLWRPNL